MSAAANRLSLVFALLGSTAAHATEWFTGEKAGDSRDWIVATDSSLTVTSTGTVFGASSATIALTDTLRDSGPRLRLQGVAGRYEYTGTSGQAIIGQQVEGSILGGYEMVGPRASLAGYLGFVARDNTLSVPDPGNRVEGTALGLKAVLEAYAAPTPDTMVSAYGSYATTYNAYFGRLKFGYDIGDRLFIGPEFAVLGDDAYRQWRAGLHATGFRIGSLSMALSAGVATDDRQRLGAYTSVDARVGF